MRCGHEHLTIRSAADCKDRLAKSSRAIGYAIGRFGKVAETTTHRVVTDEEIRKARASELKEAEAFRIVLNLAKRGIRATKAMNREHAREVAAFNIVEQFVVRLR
jgi:benzoyl-CoA reductase/2-hydroxyglutaryl-CoA dehydratase subunit BcrC/BadD/HgdB